MFAMPSFSSYTLSDKGATRLWWHMARRTSASSLGSSVLRRVATVLRKVPFPFVAPSSELLEKPKAVRLR